MERQCIKKCWSGQRTMDSSRRPLWAIDEAVIGVLRLRATGMTTPRIAAKLPTATVNRMDPRCEIGTNAP
jgi:hypothetical protein